MWFGGRKREVWGRGMKEDEQVGLTKHTWKGEKEGGRETGGQKETEEERQRQREG
jgi:hypothetical protein